MGLFLFNGPSGKPVRNSYSRIGTVTSQQNFGNNQRSKSLKNRGFSASYKGFEEDGRSTFETALSN
jgi:hypothetical protein